MVIIGFLPLPITMRLKSGFMAFRAYHGLNSKFFKSQGETLKAQF